MTRCEPNQFHFELAQAHKTPNNLNSYILKAESDSVAGAQQPSHKMTSSNLTCSHGRGHGHNQLHFEPAQSEKTPNNLNSFIKQSLFLLQEASSSHTA